MPAQPAWFHRLDKILTELRALQVSHLDRLAVEKLFRVGERRARQLMAGLPSLQVGNAVAVERLALVARLEATAAGERFQWEISRRMRLAERLEATRRELAARQVRLPAARDARNRVEPVQDLGDGIEFRRGEMRIVFSDAEDLAVKLFQLSQAMAHDWPAFVRKVG